MPLGYLAHSATASPTASNLPVPQEVQYPKPQHQRLPTWPPWLLIQINAPYIAKYYNNQSSIFSGYRAVMILGVRLCSLENPFTMPSLLVTRPNHLLWMCVAGSTALASLTIDTTVMAATLRLQAENGEIVRAGIALSHSGFTGTGYIDYANEIGSYVEWVIIASQASSTNKLIFRYANGTTGNRPLKVIVNGTPIAGSLPFPPTGAWTTWQTETAVNIVLHAGFNTIRAEAVSVNGGPNLDRADITSAVQVTLTDWAQALIQSTIAVRYPNPAQFGPGISGAFWRYQQGLYLLGQYRTYQRTGNALYRNYIKAWIDARTDASTGSIIATKTVDPTLKYLDTIMPGRVVLLLNADFGGTSGETRYKLTAKQLWDALTVHKRTPDGIFWHTNSGKNTVLLDGAYMALPFAVLYGTKFGKNLLDKSDIYHDVANQMIRDHYHLQDVAGTEVTPTMGTGLFYHGYDLEGDGANHGVDWTAGADKHSSVIWCRAMGWYAMALVDILEVLPLDTAHQADRTALITILRSLIGGLAVKQSTDGRWLTVVYYPARPVVDNFLDTSCSAMIVYAISKGVEASYLNSAYAKVASKAYKGIMRQISIRPEAVDGRTRYLTFLSGIAAGQEVQSTPELYTTSTYNSRDEVVSRINPLTNDLHGLGAFLLMYEQVKRHPETITPF